MTPPEAPQSGNNACAGDTPPAVSSRLEVLRKRRDFQRASRGKRVVMPGFILQRVAAPEDAPARIRVGFTCSKKVGNAVARNRAKRRLREIARVVLAGQAAPGFDYVLVGRRDVTATLPFDKLIADLQTALKTLQGPVT